MAIPSVYINLEDDVDKTLTRLKHNRANQVILVCPKRCFLFSNPDNLKLLKQETDAIGKEVFVLTMDERGKQYAQEAGFQLKFLPKGGGNPALSDIKFSKKIIPNQIKNSKSDKNILTEVVKEVRLMVKKVLPNAEIPKENIFDEVKNNKIKPSFSPKVEVTDAVFPSEAILDASDYNNKENQEKTPTTRIITGIVAVSLVVILLLVFVVLPKATVVVYARTEPVTRDMEISLAVSVTNIDVSKLVIPATKIDESSTVNESFQSQGKQQVGNKAGGTIKIYNFTKLPLNLKSSTTTLNVGSKTYNLVSDVVGLKPTTYKNPKTKEVDEASLGDSVQVVGTQGGEDFNLPAGTRMEITNQVFGSKPQVLYAKTDSEITAGTTRYLSVINQDDVTAAQTQLQNQALDQIRGKLKANGLILVDKAFVAQASQFITDNPIGTQTPTFHATMQIKINGLAYKQKDLDSLIKQRISQTLSANKTLESKEPKATDVLVKNLDLNNQIVSLNVHYEGQAVYDLDLPNINTQLAGKTRNQANEILRSKAEIDRVDITLAPIWQKNFPLFANKINVTIAK